MFSTKFFGTQNAVDCQSLEALDRILSFHTSGSRFRSYIEIRNNTICWVLSNVDQIHKLPGTFGLFLSYPTSHVCLEPFQSSRLNNMHKAKARKKKTEMTQEFVSRSSAPSKKDLRLHWDRHEWPPKGNLYLGPFQPLPSLHYWTSSLVEAKSKPSQTFPWLIISTGAR